jgi:hypothetical protein
MYDVLKVVNVLDVDRESNARFIGERCKNELNRGYDNAAGESTL